MFQVEDQPEWLYTDNESNNVALWGPNAENSSKYTKDAFHRYVVSTVLTWYISVLSRKLGYYKEWHWQYTYQVNGEKAAVNPRPRGTKVAAHQRLEIPAGQTRVLKMRLFAPSKPTGIPQEHKAAFGKCRQLIPPQIR